MKFETPQMAWNYEIESINSIDFNPIDNTEFIVCSSDSRNQGTYMRIWKLQQEKIFEQNKDNKFAQPIIELKGHTKAINIVRYNQDGNQIATGSDDCKVIVWIKKQRPKNFGSNEMQITWAENKVLTGHTKEIYDLNWIDNNYIVSGSHDYTIIIWDINKGRMNQRIDGPTQYVKSICVDPFKKYICVQSCDRSLRILSKQKIKKLSYYIKYCINKVVLDINKDKQIETKLFLTETSLESFFRKIDWSPDGQFFITPLGEYNNLEYQFCAYVFHRNNLKLPALAYPFEEPVLYVSFAPNIFQLQKNETSIFKNYNNKVYFSLASQNQVAIYNTCSLIPFFIIKNFHFASLTDLKWNSNGLLAIGSLDGYISFADLTDKFSKEKQIENNDKLIINQ